MEEFAASFHSLSGTTIGERRKNLFLLLNRTKRAGHAELDFSSIQPKTPLEEKFKVETLIYFRRVPDLLKVLSSENPILIETVLKSSSWFVEEAFGSLTGEELVTAVFSHISFNTKVKIVNKLSLYLKDPQRADSFYSAIERKYGLYLAAKLLPSCSSELIMDCVKSNRIKLTPRQLQSIVQKYPQITEEIVKQSYDKDKAGQEYKKVFIFLAKRDIGLFLKLCKEYDLSFHLGWRVTDKLIQTNREKIVSTPNAYYQFLHKKQIAKSLKVDFEGFYINLFPKMVEQFKNWSNNALFLLKTSKMQNLDLLLSTFESVYASQLWDHPTFVTTELLEMLSPDERESRMKIEYKPARMSDEEWFCYRKTENSIPFLKKRISLSSDIKTRAELVELLVKTCKINDDKVALVDMCKYMVTQHRNDHVSVRLGFLRSLRRRFKFEELSKLHWEPINELIKIFTLNDEQFYHSGEFLEAYIHHRLINNLPVKEQLSECVKTQSTGLNIIKEKPEYEKRCLFAFREIIPEAFSETELRRWHVKFLAALMDWNKRHQSDRICLFAYTKEIQSLKEGLSEVNYVYDADSVAPYCLRMKVECDVKSSLLNAYLSKQDRYIFMDVMNWLIKYEPLTVLENIDAVTQAVLRSQYARTASVFWQFCRNYSHLEMPRKVIDICRSEQQKEVQSSDRDATTQNIVTALSYLMPPDEFLAFIVAYYPTDLRANAKSEEGRKLYKLQRGIALCLKNMNPPSHALASILMFCKGDYFKVTQRSLYSVVGNVNEDVLVPFFSELLKRAVSVRKHAMHLAFRVLDKSQVWSMLNHFMQAAESASICKFIFKCSFNFFTKNRSDYSWDLVKLNMNTVVIDKEVIGILIQVGKIPHEYLVKYVPFTWDVLSKLPDPDGDIEASKAILLSSLACDTVQLLPQEFCEALIKDNLFKCDAFTYFQSVVQSFTCKYIIYCKSPMEQGERLKSNFEVLRNYVVDTWHNSDSRHEGRSCVVNFLKTFCSEFLDNKCEDKEILVKFAELWSGLLKPHEAFEEYLHLRLTLIYVEKLDLPEIGRTLAALCDSLVKAYGPVVVNVLYDKINHFNNLASGKDDVSEENRYSLIESFIKPDSSVMCLLLALLLLNNNYPATQKAKAKYNTIMEMFGKSRDPVIQMYLHRHLKNVKT